MNRYVRLTASYSTYERLAPSYGPTMDRCIRRTASSMVEVPFTGTLAAGTLAATATADTLGTGTAGRLPKFRFYVRC